MMGTAPDEPTTIGRFAVGRAGRHHGEILQGLWWPRAADGTDPLPCLVTLPMPQPGSEAHFTSRGDRRIEVHPPWKLKAARAARLALDALGATATGGLLRLHSPIPTGLGMGSSSSDVLAALRAVCSAFGAHPDADWLARLAAEAETASDPLMHDEVVLFAQRHGTVIERWGKWLPEFLLLSVDTDPQSGGHDTLCLPAPHADGMRAEFTALVQQARAAFQARDAAAVAAVATRSAELHQRTVPMRGFHALRALSVASGALGLQISHSGTIAGMLFHRKTAAGDLTPLIPQLRALEMAPIGFFRIGCDSSRDIA